MILTDADLAILVTNVEIADKDIAIGIILAESGGRTDARNVVHAPGKKWDNSLDRGLWQINSYWHATFKDYDDPYLSTVYAGKISNGGTIWTQWTTFNHGSHVKYLPRAQAALAKVAE